MVDNSDIVGKIWDEIYQDILQIGKCGGDDD